MQLSATDAARSKHSNVNGPKGIEGFAISDVTPFKVVIESITDLF